MLSNILKKYFPVLNKLIMILNTIENIKTDKRNNLYIKFKNDLIMETNGNLITYTENGVCVQKSKLTFINPKLNKEVSYTDLGNEELIFKCSKQAGIECDKAISEQKQLLEERDEIREYIKKQKDKRCTV